MKRRTFLTASGATLASVLLPKLSFAIPINRAAVVIGVDKSGSLPVLRAAASGASAFAVWLIGEGFDVERFIDGPNVKVKVNPIFEAIRQIIDRDIYEQIVVYFSGHGFLNSYRELWMLSDAPDNPNQAISLLECEHLCKRSGIPNVVFISDACRSTATSIAADSVRGSVIFPASPRGGRVITKVDTFLATQQGDPAYEVEVNTAVDNYHGIFTASFLDAFKTPESGMVTMKNGVEVILNRDLEDYLRRDVNRRAQIASITLEQRPETNVLSDQYIGQVRRSTTSPPTNPPPPGPSITEVTALAFVEKGFNNFASLKPLDTTQATGAGGPWKTELTSSTQHVRIADNATYQQELATQLCEKKAQEVAQTINATPVGVTGTVVKRALRTERGPFFDRWQKQYLDMKVLCNGTLQKHSDKIDAFKEAKQRIELAEGQAPTSFETKTGLFVSGIGIREVLVNPNFYDAERAHGKGPGAIRLIPRQDMPASVAIRFSDGSGTVVAALRGYIGTVVVDEGRVVSVTYTRSDSNPVGSPREKRLRELRRLVATSARFGTFRITGKGNAERLADQIRALKAVDPTLGVYAAYAYSDADMPQQINSVRDYMQHDIHGQIFDVALLADVLAQMPPDRRRGIAPFCPMLSQGWGLLRIANVDLPPDISKARDHIKPALWTTFRPTGMDLVMGAIASGQAT